MPVELSIIVPCYNEQQNLENLLHAFAISLGSASDVELILVDNGSNDQTAQKLKDLFNLSRFHFARSVRVEVNRGYGFGIMSGLRSAQSNYLAWTHADLQTPPEDVLKAFEVLRSASNPEQTLVRGLRKNRPLFDQSFTSAMGWIASAAMGSKLYDVNAQPKVFHKNLLAEMTEAPNDFTLDLYLLHRANQLALDIKTVDVRFEDRTAGESKGGGTLKGKYKLCKRTLLQIWKLRKDLKNNTKTLLKQRGTTQVSNKNAA